jgi:hypothetical protein
MNQFAEGASVVVADVSEKGNEETAHMIRESILMTHGYSSRNASIG